MSEIGQYMYEMYEYIIINYKEEILENRYNINEIIRGFAMIGVPLLRTRTLIHDTIDITSK